MKTRTVSILISILIGLSTQVYAAGVITGWGDNSDKQIDIPANLTNVVAIAAGDSHSVALKSDGTVVAWGDDYDGQATVPVGLSNVVAVAAGYDRSLEVKKKPPLP